jgi:hypothetical protein
VSVPAGFTPTEHMFDAAVVWVKEYFSVPVLSAMVHSDEAAEHLHALLLPLKDGCMQGSRLVGNRKHLQAMQASFYESVGRAFGLSRATSTRRPGRAQRARIAAEVLEHLHANPDKLALPDVRLAMLECLESSAEHIALSLGLAVSQPKPTKKSKTFVEIMTKPCKAEPQAKPIGFQSKRRSAESEAYPCVGFAEDGGSASQVMSPQFGLPAFEYTRVRDDERSALWDGELGEFRPEPVKKLGTRHAALAAVRQGAPASWGARMSLMGDEA